MVVREKLSASEVPSLRMNFSYIECVLVPFTANAEKFLIGNVFVPPNDCYYSSTDSINMIFESFMQIYS